MKQCSRCKKLLSGDSFHKESKNLDGLHRWCKNCQRQWRLLNKDKENKNRRQWYLENRKKRLEQNRILYWKNKAENQPKRRLWSAQNKELVSKRWKDWSKLNQDYLKAKKAERKARILNNGGSFTKQEWLDLKNKFNNKCLACDKSESEIELTPDHIIPLIKGGTSFIENIQPLCRSCNCSKRAEVIDYREGGFYGFPI